MKKLENLELSNSFAKLGADFLQKKLPEPVSSPYLIDSNPAAMQLIGLEFSEVKKNGPRGNNSRTNGLKMGPRF